MLMFFYATLILTEDFRGFKIIRIDVSTAYAVLLAVTSFSHMIALFGWDDNHFYFARFYSREMSGRAIFIFNLGSIIITEVMRWYLHVKREPPPDWTITNRFSFWTLFLISVLIFTSSTYFQRQIPSLGAVGTFYVTMVTGSVFLLSFLAHYRNRHILVTFVYTVFLSIWALQYYYLRMNMLIPWVAYLVGEVMAKERIYQLHRYSKAAIILGFIVFPPIFSFLGENRERISGDRLKASLEQLSEENTNERQTILSRLSIIPQVSHVIKLTESNGFYDGKTLQYLAFVFIPRFIWPEKPQIRQGQWFALEIGNARLLKGGFASNSINMTVPGEFYLNFGWTGLLAGCSLFGLFMGWLWSQTDYLSFYGWMFRFYLLFLGLFSLGADLQIIPSLLSFILIYKFIIWVNRW